MKKKYQGPAHRWVKANLEEERVLEEKYGFKSKKEYYKTSSLLKEFKDKAKKFITTSTEQADKEKENLLRKLRGLGLLKEDSELDNILELKIEDLLERRLQTLVFKKRLANSIKQARQLITHRQVMIGNKKITRPSYLVSLEEEELIHLSPYSSFKITEASKNE